MNNPYQSGPDFEPVFPTRYKVLAVLLVLVAGGFFLARNVLRDIDPRAAFGDVQRLEDELAAARAENVALRAELEALRTGTGTGPTPPPITPGPGAPGHCDDVDAADLQETIQRISQGAAMRQLDEAQMEALLTELQTEADCLGIQLPPLDTFRDLI